MKVHDAYGCILDYARRHAMPWSPEWCIEWAMEEHGIFFDDSRSWGAVFRQVAKDGYIKRCGLFPRVTSNGSVRPGWVRA